MCELTFVSRASDGLLLVEAWSESITLTNVNKIKTHAISVLRKIRELNSSGCIEDNNCTFYYEVQEGICYMTVCASSYPQRLAFSYLQEIQKFFIDELLKEYSNSKMNINEIIGSIEKPYSFIKLDTFILRKSNDYRNPHSTKALDKLNQELRDVEIIVRKNIVDVLDRGTSLKEIDSRAAHLKTISNQLKTISKKMMLQAMFQKYIPYIVIILVVFSVVLWKWFF